ncbi:MAG TPA: hypothetical protein VJZ51_05575 [Bacilli bacterium]|nr:hypothetical protein [Bacilli bacterium]
MRRIKANEITIEMHNAHGLTTAQLIGATQELNKQIMQYGLEYFETDIDGLYVLSVEYPALAIEVDFETFDGSYFEVMNVNDL